MSNNLIIETKAVICGDDFNSPTLIVCMEGHDYNIINFRGCYFTTSDRTLSGRDGQVDSTIESYDNMFRTITYVLGVGRHDSKVIIKDDNDLVEKFKQETMKYFHAILK